MTEMIDDPRVELLELVKTQAAKEPTSQRSKRKRGEECLRQSFVMITTYHIITRESLAPFSYRNLPLMQGLHLEHCMQIAVLLHTPTSQMSCPREIGYHHYHVAETLYVWTIVISYKKKINSPFLLPFLIITIILEINARSLDLPLLLLQ